MKKYIELQEQHIEYTVKESRRARRMRLAISPSKGLVATIPSGMSLGTLEEFIFEKSEWIIKKLEYFKKFSGVVLPRSTRNDYLKHKESARALMHEKVEYFSSTYGFSYSKISVKNQKTCWGSCSKRGNLNFNYKILFLPEQAQDYIVVHELCHLKELNHSKKFWALVAEIVSDYAEIRKDLKKIL